MIPVTGASQAADAVDKSSQKDSNSLMIFFDEKAWWKTGCVKISNNLLNYIEKGNNSPFYYRNVLLLVAFKHQFAFL